jgi:hypothetical protein
VSVEFGYFEEKNCDCSNFGFSRLVERISCAWGCIYNSVRISTDTNRRRWYISPYSIFKQEDIRFRTKLQHNGERRVGYGLCIAKIHTLLFRTTF